tara:strand:+ start:623 stop:1015 length:393 start_codon:yes stop_codon:yes gene_type:complete
MRKNTFEIPKDPAEEIFEEIKKQFPWFCEVDEIGVMPVGYLLEAQPFKGEKPKAQPKPLSELVRWCLCRAFDMGHTKGVESCQEEIKEAHQNAIKSRAEFNRFAAFIDCCIMDGDKITKEKIDAFLKGEH